MSVTVTLRVDLVSNTTQAMLMLNAVSGYMLSSSTQMPRFILTNTKAFFLNPTEMCKNLPYLLNLF